MVDPAPSLWVQAVMPEDSGLVDVPLYPMPLWPHIVGAELRPPAGGALLLFGERVEAPRWALFCVPCQEPSDLTHRVVPHVILIDPMQPPAYVMSQTAAFVTDHQSCRPRPA